MWWAIGGGIVVGVALAAWLIRRRIASNRNPISIVMLRSRPANLAEADVRQACRRAYGSDPREIHRIDLPDGAGHSLVAVFDDKPSIGVIVCAKPYMSPEEAEATAADLEHPVTRQAMTGHVAWVSVDVMGSTEIRHTSEVLAGAHGFLAPLAAELIDDACLLLYLSASKKVAEPGEKAEAMLREGRLAELFGDAELHAPMLHAREGDPQIARAMAEAKRRLPEFVMAFERAGGTGDFLFKARYSIGPDGSGDEYVWLRLEAIERDAFVGTIENNTDDPAIPKKGARDRVPIDRVADWGYADETGEMQGVFVDRILMSRQRG